MTEQEWLDCSDPTPMLEFLRDKASDRKLRLFAVAYCRSIWPSLTSIRSRRSVEISELYADGRSARKTVIAAGGVAMAAIRDAAHRRSLPEWLSVAAAWNAARNCAFSNAWEAARYASGNPQIANPVNAPLRQYLARLLQEVFGSFFRPFAIDRARLAWNNGTISKLAQAIYDDRQLPSGHFDTARLAVLADALEEAGCDNKDILDHCRGPGPHVRGCWVVDLILGKE